jgi:hypothetical protein
MKEALRIYENVYNAIKLAPKKQQAALALAIIEYGFGDFSAEKWKHLARNSQQILHILEPFLTLKSSGGAKSEDKNPHKMGKSDLTVYRRDVCSKAEAEAEAEAEIEAEIEAVKTIPNPNPSPQGEGIEEFKRVIQSCQITDEARAAQAQIAKCLEDNGYNCVLEFPIADRGDGRRGRIDILAEKNGLKFAIEFDNAACRNKSVFKLLQTDFLKIILLRNGEAQSVEGIDWVFSFGLNDFGEPVSQVKPEDLNAGTFRKPCKTKLQEAAKTWAEYKAPELIAKGTAAQTKIFITRHVKTLKDLLVMVDDDIELLSWLFAGARDRFKDL